MSKVTTPYDELTYKIIGIAMTVHNELGPGLNEEMYKKAMSILLDEQEIVYSREFAIPINFRNRLLGTFKLDFIVNQKVIVEVKAVSSFAPIHEQQLLTYLTASGLPVGLLINFGASSLQHKRLFPPNAVQSSPIYKSRQPK
ncbi:MAG: GxxExxY protein [Chloroflexi bacterium]|nr:GxxExxY protein [Chloroflexota bacterium]